jgi:hypothetical protein
MADMRQQYPLHLFSPFHFKTESYIYIATEKPKHFENEDGPYTSETSATPPTITQRNNSKTDSTSICIMPLIKLK